MLVWEDKHILPGWLAVPRRVRWLLKPDESADDQSSLLQPSQEKDVFGAATLWMADHQTSIEVTTKGMVSASRSSITSLIHSFVQFCPWPIATFPIAQDFRLVFLLSATVFVSCTSGSPLEVKHDDSAGVSLPFGTSLTDGNRLSSVFLSTRNNGNGFYFFASLIYCQITKFIHRRCFVISLECLAFLVGLVE